MAPKLGPAEAAVCTGVSWAIAAAFLLLPAFARPKWEAARSFVGNDALFFSVGTWATNVVVTVVGNALMFCIYRARSPFFERFKLSSKPWPWHGSPDEVAAFRAFLPRSLALVAFNNVFIAFPGALLMYVQRVQLGHVGLDASLWPSTGVLLAQLAFCAVIEDTMFFWTHRCLHHRAIYPYIHKVHHQYYQSWTLASEHAHPVEFAVGNLAPLMGGPSLLTLAAWASGEPRWNLHAVGLWMWVALRIAVSLDEHCGYAFPWSPVRLLPALGASTLGHDWHHSHNAGVYASQFTWWDAACGTDKAFNEWRAKQESKAAGEGGLSGTLQAAQPSPPVEPNSTPRRSTRAASTSRSGR